MKSIILFILYLLSLNTFIAQSIPPDSLYLAQAPPGDSAVVFAPGLISLPGRKESCITFTPDGKTCVFSVEFWPSSGIPYTMITEYKNNKWSAITYTPFTQNRMTNEPIFAFNGMRIYLDANPTLNQVGSVDLSYVSKIDTLWTNPVSLSSPPNSSQDQYHPCIVADTSVYFSSGTGLIVRSQFHNGLYQQRVILPYPINYANAVQTWGDPYVAPDESYMIFKSTRTGGYGLNDIYISYKKPDGNWTNPKNLGSKINTPYDERSGDITPDGLYMTFGSNNDLYWVSTGFISTIKHTNFIPYLKNQIQNKTDTTGHSFYFTVPDSTFIDDDGNNTLSYSAVLNNGNNLPSWLNFNPSTRTFSGNPVVTSTDTIKVTVTDTANASASCIFILKIVNPISVRQIHEQIINEYKLSQNYPNPFNPVTNIKFSIPKSGNVMLRVYDMLGKEIDNLYNGYLKAGTYNAFFDANNLSSGIYFYVLKTNSFTERKKMVVLK